MKTFHRDGIYIKNPFYIFCAIPSKENKMYFINSRKKECIALNSLKFILHKEYCNNEKI